jgi:hypothetical protein
MRVEDLRLLTQPAFLEAPPIADTVTAYDEEHLITYLRLLDAAAEGADWREVASVVFGLNPASQEAHSREVYESHLARARWMTEHGYRQLAARGRQQS